MTKVSYNLTCIFFLKSQKKFLILLFLSQSNCFWSSWFLSSVQKYVNRRLHLAIQVFSGYFSFQIVRIIPITWVSCSDFGCTYSLNGFAITHIHHRWRNHKNDFDSLQNDIKFDEGNSTTKRIHFLRLVGI